MVPYARYKTGLRDVGKYYLAQPHTLFERGTINHSDTSPSFKFYPKTSFLGKFGGVFNSDLI